MLNEVRRRKWTWLEHSLGRCDDSILASKEDGDVSTEHSQKLKRLVCGLYVPTAMVRRQLNKGQRLELFSVSVIRSMLNVFFRSLLLGGGLSID